MATVYEAFDNFIKEVVLKKEDNGKIFTCKNGANKNIEPNFQSLYEMFTKDNKEGNQKFGDKVKEQIKTLKSDKESILLALAYVEWLWKLPSSNMKNKTPNILSFKDIEKVESQFLIEVKDDYKSLDGIGSSGQFHNQNKYHEITFLAWLMSYLTSTFKKENNEQDNVKLITKIKIEKICLDIIEPKLKGKGAKLGDEYDYAMIQLDDCEKPREFSENVEYLENRIASPSTTGLKENDLLPVSMQKDEV